MSQHGLELELRELHRQSFWLLRESISWLLALSLLSAGRKLAGCYGDVNVINTGHKGLEGRAGGRVADR